MKARTPDYCKNNTYAAGVSFETVMETTLQIAKLLEF